MKRHPAEIAALAEVVQLMVDELARHRRPIGEPAREAIALVGRWLAGEAVPPGHFRSAIDRAHENGVPREKREPDRALSWAHTAAGNLACGALSSRSLKETQRATLDAAVYALDSLGVAGVPGREAFELLQARALEKALAAKPAVPPAAAPRGPKPWREDLAPFIGKVAEDWLRGRRPRFDAAQKGSDATLSALLAQHGHPAHAAVLAFERRYGGLLAPDAPGEEDWLFGAFACLSSGAHETKGSALVPVVYSPNDLIYLLDGSGAAWAHDSIEDPQPVRFAVDGDRMMARIFLHQMVFARGVALELKGRRGEAAAEALGLLPIAEASDPLGRAWGSSKTLVLEEPLDDGWQTRIVGASKRALATL